jgi:hypothetical protein
MNPLHRGHGGRMFVSAQTLVTHRIVFARPRPDVRMSTRHRRPARTPSGGEHIGRDPRTGQGLYASRRNLQSASLARPCLIQNSRRTRRPPRPIPFLLLRKHATPSQPCPRSKIPRRHTHHPMPSPRPGHAIPAHSQRLPLSVGQPPCIPKRLSPTRWQQQETLRLPGPAGHFHEHGTSRLLRRRVLVILSPARGDRWIPAPARGAR